MARQQGSVGSELRVSAAMLAFTVVVSACMLVPTVRALFPPCPFREVTGLWCPGCGSTRALDALMHGHVLTAIGMNPLAMLLAPLVGYALLRDTLELGGIARWPRVPVSPRVVSAFAVIVFAYWVLRNIPVYPFTLVAPG